MYEFKWVEKCSTVYDNKSCKSGYLNDTSRYREIEERKRWLANLPNVIKLGDVIKNMGVCLKHWEADFKYRIGSGSYLRPLHPPTEFGRTPKSFASLTTIEDRRIEERSVTSEKRSEVSTKAAYTKDIISSWKDLCSFCKDIPLAMQSTGEVIKLVELGDSPLIIEFLISVQKDFTVKAYRGSTLINIRDVIDSFQCKLTSYSQIDEIIARLSDYPSDLQADIGHAGEYLSKLVDISDFEAAKKKKVYVFM